MAVESVHFWSFPGGGTAPPVVVRKCPAGHFQERACVASGKGARPEEWPPCMGCFLFRRLRDPRVLGCSRLRGKAYRAAARRLAREGLAPKGLAPGRRKELDQLAQAQGLRLLQAERNHNNHSVLYLQCPAGHLLRRYRYRSRWAVPCEQCSAPTAAPSAPSTIPPEKEPAPSPSPPAGARARKRGRAPKPARAPSGPKGRKTARRADEGTSDAAAPPAEVPPAAVATTEVVLPVAAGPKAAAWGPPGSVVTTEFASLAALAADFWLDVVN